MRDIVCIKYYKNPVTLFAHVFSHLPESQSAVGLELLGWVFVEITIVLAYAATVITTIIIIITTNQKPKT